MKIVCNKKEFAALIRECDSRATCAWCLLAPLCGEKETVEARRECLPEICEVVEDKEAG